MDNKPLLGHNSGIRLKQGKIETMDIREVKKFIQLVHDTGVAELEIKTGDDAVRIVNGQSTKKPIESSPVVHSIQEEPKQPLPQNEKHHELKSPMVGTFYIAPSPDAKPFVSVGQHVKKGDIMCVVEAMKMFNQIEADKDGIITKRCVENAEPVEFGQALFIIE